MRPGLGRPELLAGLGADPGRTALLSDFDGTLAAIVDDPAGARPLPGVVALLHDLAARFAVVGVISGRPLQFLREHLGSVGAPGAMARSPRSGHEGGGVRLAGLYGLEQVGPGGATLRSPEATSWSSTIDQVATTARSAAPPGTEVEPKGLAVTLHWRRAPEAAEWGRSFALSQAAATGLVAHDGRQSVELRPPVPTDKGTVVAEWCTGMAAACFFGDDRGDLKAFAALDGLASQGRARVWKVAVGSPELPEELASAADVIVEGPGDVVALLGQLARPT